MENSNAALKTVLGYAIVEEFTKGNINAKRDVAISCLNNLSLVEQEADLIMLNHFSEENKLLDVFKTIVDLTDKMIQDEKFDKDSLTLVKDTIELLSKQLTEGIKKYEIE